jgi:hypothetical protein
MDIVQYQGYDIQAVPRKLANGGKWELNIKILRHSESATKVRNFFAADTYDTREEAVQNCFRFGKQIIDGQLPGCTVADI